MKRFRFISGLAVGFVLGSTIIAGANQAIQAILNNQVKVSLDGKVQTFRDETTGELQYPITYNDRTYLPLRNVATLSGLTVDYDADTNTAILMTKEYASKYNTNTNTNTNKSSYNYSTAVYAQFARFTNNFPQYSDRCIMDALDTKQILGIREENVNDAQLYYMTANGLRTAKNDVEVYNRLMPVGYIMPKTIANIYGLDTEEERKNVVAYIIDDKNITGYNANGNLTNGSAGYEFYGDTHGQEYHFITSNGDVFTLPGHAFPLEDGTVKFYVSFLKGKYYVAKGNSNLNVGEKNVEGDIVDEEGPILPNKTMKGNLYGLTKNNVPVTKYGDSTTDAAADQPALENVVGTREGRYTTLENNK